MFISMSHPVWVRGLKLLTGDSRREACASHPVWVRGLKRQASILSCSLVSVAPRVGAWIET